jgi:hypothetical protein
MKKVEEYLRHAEECRAMAAQSSNPDHKAKLADMVKTWEMLVETRKAALERKKILNAMNPDETQTEAEPIPDDSRVKAKDEEAMS